MVEFGGNFLNIFRGSVDGVIYKDYTVNRRFFICCSLPAHGFLKKKNRFRFLAR